MIDYFAEVKLGVSIEEVKHHEEDGEMIFPFDVEVALRCNHGSTTGYFNPVTGDAEPPSGPEFGLEYFEIGANNKFTWAEMKAMFGEEVTEHIFETAHQMATDSGEF
jgi:hypothetical protein